jgi:hypothetical protein
VLWAELRILVRDTGVVWWRLLPLILGVYLLGWLGSEVTLWVAVIVGDFSAWLALALFAFSFVCTLVSVIVILTLAGRELGISQLLPQDEREIDDRDTSISHLITITLLPFLGMYAAFGQVADAAQRLVTQQWVRYGFLSDQKTILGVLNDLATNHLPWLVMLLVGIYVLRRLLDYIADRTGLRILGLVVVLIEAFFMLLVIMGGIRVFQTFQNWFRDRAVLQWLAELQDAAARVFAIFKIDLPDLLTRAWTFFSDQVWPVLIDVVAQPLFWLAVAALVFGSKVLSLAELWRKGQSYTARIPGATAFASYSEKRAFRRIGPPPKGIRLAAARFQEAFLGDINDKYLPALHALRLVVLAGPILLGSYIFVYNLVIIAGNYLENLMYWIVGGHEGPFWVRWEPVFDLIPGVLVEPVRLCLLAVAFHRCLELFAQRAAVQPRSPRAEPFDRLRAQDGALRQAQGSGRCPSTGSGHISGTLVKPRPMRAEPVEARVPRQAQGTSRSKMAGVLAAIALIGLSAVGLRLSEPEEKFQVIGGRAGETIKINNGEVTVTRVRVGTFLSERDQIADRTPGMFVAVTVTGAATGPKDLKLTKNRLLSKQVRYDSYKSLGGLIVSPGFQTSIDEVFEVDPAQIDDLTLEMWPNESISGYQEHVRIKLGITAENAEQWRAAGKDRGIEVSRGSTRAIP